MTKEINWNRRKYTEDEFIEAWNTSNSVAECIRKLGFKVGSGHYETLNYTAKILGLTKEHMTEKGWNIGDKLGLAKINTRPVEEYLRRDIKVSSHSLKKRLIKEGLLETKCSAPFCPITFIPVDPFTGEKAEIKLTLDHIDGDKYNNLLTNLRLLCTYCHPYTETWTGKNIGKRDPNKKDSKTLTETYKDKERKKNPKGTPLCCLCKDTIKSSKSRLCVKCYRKYRLPNIDKKEKISWPLDSELIDMVKSSSYLATSKVLGVSDNAIRKRLRNRGYDLKTFEKSGMM